jgi:hypothetical protein
MQQAQAQQAVVAMQQASARPAPAHAAARRAPTRRVSQQGSGPTGPKHPAAAAGWRRGWSRSTPFPSPPRFKDATYICSVTRGRVDGVLKTLSRSETTGRRPGG